MAKNYRAKYSELMKSIISVIILPGIIIGVFPFSWGFFFSKTTAIHPYALVPYFMSWGLIIYCTILFDRQGKGTIAPWAPPTHLVISGAFYLTRNPIFLAMIIGNISVSIFFNSVF